MNFAESKTSPSSIADSQGPRFEADGRGAAGKGPEAERAAKVWKEGAGRSATSEAEREKGYVGSGKEYSFTGVGIILDNLAKDNKDNAKFYLYLYLR